MSKQIEIIVPTSWNEVSVNTFQELKLIKREDFKTDFNYLRAIIKHLCNIEDIDKIPLNIINEISEEVKFINAPITTERFKEVKIDNDTYRWVGSFNSLTVGEIISIEQIIDLEELTFDLSTDVVAAILLRKVLDDGSLEEFNSDLYNERRELFGNVSIADVNGMLVFFLNGGQSYTKTTTGYLVVKAKRTNIQKRSKLLRMLLGQRFLKTPLING